MAKSITHRGPDDMGVVIDAKVGLALGYRRLAVLDLSPTGNQPMASQDGRWLIAYNGEIYNFRSLRADLQASGTRFRGTSDTEVLVEAIARWGIRSTLKRANGMFAFAAWDQTTRALCLARDRFGEKPLYYGCHGTTLLFGSELKALRAHPAFRGCVDGTALGLYLRHNYVPAPHSIYSDIKKLPPASFLRIEAARGPGQEMPPDCYWSAMDVAAGGRSNPIRIDAHDATNALADLLAESVAIRTVADVPIGAFLSGGIDSSTVVALMQSQSSERVRTFTIGFHEADYDEAETAAAVATHLGTDHTEFYVTPADVMAVIPRLPHIFDEPFADSSQLPTFLVADLARRQVTVSLSGDGGDELFGGYGRYQLLERLWRTIGVLPIPLRVRVASALRLLPPDRWDQLVAPWSWALPSSMANGRFGDRIHKLAEVASTGGVDALYRKLVSHWDRSPLLYDTSEPLTPFTTAAGMRWPSATDMAMAIDTITYLPDDILTKLDRTTMAVSLEARVPLLDPQVFEFAWRLPRQLLKRNGTSKWLLREVLHRHVPAALVDRPKMGFGVPIGSWLRGPLRPWAEELLAESLLRDDGYLDVDYVRRRWKEHLGGVRDWKYQLWGVLMFQAWLHDSGN